MVVVDGPEGVPVADAEVEDPGLVGGVAGSDAPRFSARISARSISRYEDAALIMVIVALIVNRVKLVDRWQMPS